MVIAGMFAPCSAYARRMFGHKKARIARAVGVFSGLERVASGDLAVCVHYDPFILGQALQCAPKLSRSTV